MLIKNAFEMLMKIFQGMGTELVEDTSLFDPIVGVDAVACSAKVPIGGRLRALRFLGYKTLSLSLYGSSRCSEERFV